MMFLFTVCCKFINCGFHNFPLFVTEYFLASFHLNAVTTALWLVSSDHRVLQNFPQTMVYDLQYMINKALFGLSSDPISESFPSTINTRLND
jgi:hypothetical protein